MGGDRGSASYPLITLRCARLSGWPRGGREPGAHFVHHSSHEDRKAAVAGHDTRRPGRRTLRRLAGGLVIVMAALIGVIAVALGSIVLTIRRERAAEDAAEDQKRKDASGGAPGPDER